MDEPRKWMIHVHVRTVDRAVEQWTTTYFAPKDVHVERDDDDNVIAITPKFDHGATHERAGCVVEEIAPETLAAIIREMPDHGGGVYLSEDHQTVYALPEPAGYRELHAAQAQRAADLALLAASDDPRHAAIARLFGGG